MFMYFKQLAKKAANEIIEKEKKVSEKHGWDLDFCLETIYGYEEIVLKVKDASNYQKVVSSDMEDLEKQYGEEDNNSFDLWVISDHILEVIENKGYKVV